MLKVILLPIRSRTVKSSDNDNKCVSSLFRGGSMRKFDSSGSTRSRLMTRRQRWQVMGLVALTAILAVGSMKRGGNLNAAAGQSSGGTARAGKLLPGTASVSGTVTASEPFKAAQVYFRNPEKRMTY